MMNAFDLVFGVIALAAITSWFAIRNSKTNMELRFETLLVAISWIVALLVSYRMLVGA